MNSKKLVQCGDTPYTALDLVLQSFGNLAAYFTTISNALTAIQGRIQSDCISISGTFAAHSSGPTAQDIFGSIVSVLQLVPALASGRIWGKVCPVLPPPAEAAADPSPIGHEVVIRRQDGRRQIWRGRRGETWGDFLTCGRPMEHLGRGGYIRVRIWSYLLTPFHLMAQQFSEVPSTATH
jgi:hypothetical protein